MANHGVLIKVATQSDYLDSLVRGAVASYDIDNGNVCQLGAKSSTSGEGELWVAATPASGAGLQYLWMAAEPAVVITVSGSKQYKGINPDVRDFYNIAGLPFTVFAPQIGDLIELSADALAGTISTNTFVVATAGASALTWAASAVSGLSLKLRQTKYISIADGTLGSTQRTVSYLFEVTAVA